MAGFELPACLQAAFVVVAGNQERERAFKSVIMSVLAVRWPTVFSTDRAWCLHDLTGSESCVLFSQGGMTLAYDPTALQNG